MKPEVFTITLPLYKAPTRRLEEFVSSFAANPRFLMQVVPNQGTVLFIPNNDADVIKVPIKLFVRKNADLKPVSRFCTKFNMLSSIVSNANTGHKANFMLELDGNCDSYTDAVKVFSASFKVDDPAVILTIGNLSKLLE